MLRSHAAPRHASLFLARLLPLLAVASAAAQSSLVQMPTEDVTFVTRHWHSGNGLPQNTVYSILQDRTGRLWAATLGGLCSFDGERMRVFDPVTTPALRSSRFTSLCEDADGVLWLGSDIGGLHSHRDGVFAHHPEVACANVRAIAEGADGRLFVATDTGTYVRRGGVFAKVDDPRVARASTVQRGTRGDVYLCSERRLYRWGASGLDFLVEADVRCVLELGTRLLVGTTNGLFCLADGSLHPWRPVPGLEQATMALHQAKDGALWIGTWMRTYRIARSMLPDRDSVELDSKFAPLQSARETQAARSIFEDREGGIWVGYTERGMVRHWPADVRAHGHRSGLPQRNLAAVSGDGAGGVLVTTIDGLFRKVGNTFVREVDADPMAPMRTLLVDPDGTQWIAGRLGLARRSREGMSIVVPGAVWPADRAVAMERAPDGALWIAGAGVARFDGALTIPPYVSSFADRAVRTIAFGPDGAMWLGCTDGLARIDTTTGDVREWRSGSEIPFGQVRTVLPEAGEHAWIAVYGGGVVRIDGARCVSVDERHGMHDQHLCGMIELGDDFALATNRGLCLVGRAEMAAVARGEAPNLACRLFGAPGGGPAEMHGGYQDCMVVVDGVLWCVGIEGLYEFDPARLTPLPHDLPTHVQDLVVGDRREAPSESLSLPPEVRSLAIRLGTCAFEDGEQVRFRWRLLGVRDEWSSPTYDRDVHLVDLPPGEHVFEASTVHPGGAPATDTLRMRLFVPELWWEAVWVRFVGFALTGGFAFLLVRFGARRAAIRAARLQVLVDERTRELVAAHRHLEQRVADRTAELRTALERQEEARQEQQRLERQLQRMQRMESIGQLAGGVAHDFNNLLTVVQGASELLVGEDSPTERLELCRAIGQASQRGRNLTQHLLAVASRQHVATERLDLVKVVADMRPVLVSMLGDSIALHLDLAPSAPVRAAVTQVEQVLLNLCANARDAMPRGGEVFVTIAVHGEQVRLVVRDTGCGMAPDVVERAFEPFFSTKSKGGARGLGLATVYGIAKQWNGQARIESHPGTGTTVAIDLPVDRGEPGGKHVVVPTGAAKRVEARVLLVEDEDAVRATLHRLLTHLGCAVRAAGDGSSALELLRATPVEFDVVLSDVVMPGLHGRALVDALRSVEPDLPIVFVSGYLDGRLTHRDLADAGLEILPKPIDREQLAAALLRAMARPSPTRGASTQA